MSEKKLIILFVAAIAVVGVVWFVADRMYNSPAAASEPDVSYNANAEAAEMSENEALPPGMPMPPLSGDWISSDSKSSAAPDYAGKVVLVDIWSTFCGPCVASIPINNLLFKSYAPKGLVFVGVSPEPRAILADFKTKVDIQYPLLATSESTLKTFKIEFFPSLFLFDKSGKLVWQGSHVLNRGNKLKASFSKALKAALGDTGTPPASAPAAAK